jgi:hypothetical protein
MLAVGNPPRTRDPNNAFTITSISTVDALLWVDLPVRFFNRNPEIPKSRKNEHFQFRQLEFRYFDISEFRDKKSFRLYF